MKKLFTACLLFTAFLLQAQAPSLQWFRTMNGNLSGQDNPVKTCKDNLGNVYITGWNSDADIFLTKYDNNGNQLYSVIYDGADKASDNVYDVLADNSGNAYICGYTSTINGQIFPLVAKFDPVGNKLWEHLDTHNGSSFKSMAFDNPTNPTYLYAVGGWAYLDSMLINKISISSGLPTWVKLL